jgi:hypothetical protein
VEETLIAYCGLDCARCPVFVATARDDPALRRETAREWSVRFGPYLAEHLGRSQLEPDEMRCRGCRSDEVFLGCRICPVRSCSHGRNLPTCAACADYSTCAVIRGFHGVHPEAKVTLDGLRP